LAEFVSNEWLIFWTVAVFSSSLWFVDSLPVLWLRLVAAAASSSQITVDI